MPDVTQVLAGLVSLLKALVVGKVTDGGPSIGNTETLNPAAPEPAVAVPVEPASGGTKADAAFHDGSGFQG